MKFIRLVIVIASLGFTGSLSAHNQINQELSAQDYAELKNLCDLIVSAQLNPAQRLQLLKSIVHENDYAQLDGGAIAGIVVGSVVGAALITALVYGCVKCCKATNGCCNWFFDIFFGENGSIRPNEPQIRNNEPQQE